MVDTVQCKGLQRTFQAVDIGGGQAGWCRNKAVGTHSTRVGCVIPTGDSHVLIAPILQHSLYLCPLPCSFSVLLPLKLWSVSDHSYFGFTHMTYLNQWNVSKGSGTKRLRIIQAVGLSLLYFCHLRENTKSRRLSESCRKI